MAQFIATDGACKNNGKVSAAASYAIVFADGPVKNKIIYGRFPEGKESNSNIRGEGFAIYIALSKCIELFQEDQIKSMTLYTDSQFWIDMIHKHMPKWNATKFATQKNTDITTNLWRVYKTAAAMFPVKILFVPAHGKKKSENHDPQRSWNAIADTYANKALDDLEYGEIKETTINKK